MLVVETHQRQRDGGATQRQRVARGYLVGRRVECQRHCLAARTGTQGDDGAVGHDDGTQRQRMRRDGGDDETAAVGRQDGAAATERVGGGARRRGDDDAVAGIERHKLAVDIELRAEQRDVVHAVQRRLVQRQRQPLSVGLQACAVGLQHGALLDGIAARQQVGDQRVDIVTARRRQEAQMTEIDAHHRYVAVGSQVGGAEQRAVATDGENEIDGVGRQAVVRDTTNGHPFVGQQALQPAENRLHVSLDRANE